DTQHWAARFTQTRRTGSYQYTVTVEGNVEVSTKVPERSAVNTAGYLNTFADLGEIVRSHIITVESAMETMTVAEPLNAPAGICTLKRPARIVPPRAPSTVAETLSDREVRRPPLRAPSAGMPTGAAPQASGPSGEAATLRRQSHRRAAPP